MNTLTLRPDEPQPNPFAIFSFQGREIRVHQDSDGNPWWVANDVCSILEVRNSRQALTRLDDDEQGVISGDTLGGDQTMTTINEAGLYRLVFSSRKPHANQFKRWVLHEVLPSIRKTGGYSTQPAAPQPTPLSAAIGLLEWRNLNPTASQSDLDYLALQVSMSTGYLLSAPNSLARPAKPQLSRLIKFEAAKLGSTPEVVDRLLEDLGWQTWSRFGETWHPTALGKQLSLCGVDENNRDKPGLLWCDNITDILRPLL